MKHVLKVLNTFIGQKKEEIERKDQKIKELWNENFELKNEVKVLRNDLAELSKEHFKK
jgi:regulator of replication initiation timing